MNANGKVRVELQPILLLLFNYTASGVLPGGGGTAVRHNIPKYKNSQNNTSR
jgi:hypothetical protein